LPASHQAGRPPDNLLVQEVIFVCAQSLRICHDYIPIAPDVQWFRKRGGRTVKLDISIQPWCGVARACDFRILWATQATDTKTLVRA